MKLLMNGMRQLRDQEAFLAEKIHGPTFPSFPEGYTALGADKELSATLTSVTLIALGILLSALGLYAKLAKFAGAGTLVPITGFANSMASAAIEFKSEGFILGVGARMFQIAGPVIVYGVSATGPTCAPLLCRFA